jgi:hypothetical protein
VKEVGPLPGLGELRRCTKGGRGGPGLAQLLDQESRRCQSARIGLERAVDALEGHAHAVAFHFIRESTFAEIVVQGLSWPVQRVDNRPDLGADPGR